MTDRDQWKLVPVEPTPELLMSIAIRLDHAIGCPGYYDQPMFKGSGVTHAQRLHAALADARRVHEEIVGAGFYRAAAPTPPATSDLERENARLEAERDRYHDALIARHGGEPIALLRELDEARAERDANAKDAERYRWLREESKKRPDFYNGDERWMVSRAQGGMGQNFFGDGIDAAIDAALARAKEGNRG